jgi:tetratricopeptide (TPR) repeat protein
MKSVWGFVLVMLACIVHAQENVTEDRTDEIWSHVDARIVQQQDYWFEDGQFPKIISLLRIQNASDPKNYDILTNLGWMLENVEEKPEAERIYKQFEAENPEDPESSFPLGNFYSLNRKYPETIKVLEASLKKSPGPNTYRVLAKAYERMKNYKDAIRVWELQLKRFPNDGPAKVNIERVKKKINP